MFKNLAHVIYTILFLGIAIYGSSVVGSGKPIEGVVIIVLSRIADFILDIKMELHAGSKN